MWNKVWPKLWATVATCSVDVVSGSTAQIRANWKAIEDWTKVGHYNMDNVTSAGAHVVGKVGTLAVSSTSQISTLSAPGTGAWAWDTDKGELQILTPGGVWESATASAYSRARKDLDTGISAESSTWTIIPWYDDATERTYDDLVEFSGYTDFTAKADGYYLVDVDIHCAFTTQDFQKAVGLFKNGTATAVGRLYSRWLRTVSVTDVVYMTTGEVLQVKWWHNMGAPYSIDDANISISRLS
jgi:hypothetical protein